MIIIVSYVTKPGYEQLSSDSSDDSQRQTGDCTTGIFGVETPGVATWTEVLMTNYLFKVAPPVSHQGVLVSEPSSTLWAGKSLFRAMHFHMHLM